MNFHIGDQVMHSSFGPGVITAIDEKSIGGKTCQYYVVDTGKLTIWVVIDEKGESSIRPPMKSKEFRAILTTLGYPAESLPDRHQERRDELNARMHHRDLTNLCSIIRDLTSRALGRKLSDNDRLILKNAKEFLVDEWEEVLGTTRTLAHEELEKMLLRVQ